MDRFTVAIVIPAYNEQNTIGQTVRDATVFGTPIVVDDCSSDATSDRARQAGAIVIRHEHNQGYDGALNSGFFEASRRDFASIVTMDADGQHDAAFIQQFLSHLEHADLVVGVRPRCARWSERIFCRVAYLLYGIRDPLCGMKAYRMELYRLAGHFDSYRSIGTELTLFASKRKLRIAQMPIPVAPRNESVTRFGNSFRANLQIIRALLKGMMIRAK